MKLVFAGQIFAADDAADAWYLPLSKLAFSSDSIVQPQIDIRILFNPVFDNAVMASTFLDGIDIRNVYLAEWMQRQQGIHDRQRFTGTA